MPIRCRHVSVPRKQVLNSTQTFLILAQNFATDPCCKGLTAASRVEHVNGLLSLRKTQNRAIAAVKVL